MDNEEYVEVVYPLDQVKGIIALILFGMILGFVVGIGMREQKTEELANRIAVLAERKMEIHGAISITQNAKGDPISISDVDVSDAEVGISIIDCNSPKKDMDFIFK